MTFFDEFLNSACLSPTSFLNPHQFRDFIYCLSLVPYTARVVPLNYAYWYSSKVKLMPLHRTIIFSLSKGYLWSFLFLVWIFPSVRPPPLCPPSISAHSSGASVFSTLVYLSNGRGLDFSESNWCAGIKPINSRCLPFLQKPKNQPATNQQAMIHRKPIIYKNQITAKQQPISTTVHIHVPVSTYS